MARPGSLQRLFAGQLTCTVNALGVGNIVFLVEAARGAIKDVIRRVVDDQCPRSGRLFPQNTRGLGINGIRQCLLGFGLIDCCIACRIDDYIRGQRTYQRAQCNFIRSITFRMIDGTDFPKWCERPLQFKADLAILSGQENPHGQPPYCLPTQFW